MFRNPPDEERRRILQEAKNIAVVGMSDKKDRTSYLIAEQMPDRPGTGFSRSTPI